MQETPRKVFLVGLTTSQANLTYELEELGNLAKANNLDPVETFTQKLERPNPATYFGKGKVEEISAAVATYEVDMIVANDELTPSQIRNLEKATNATVVDRTGLILDIFAQRAQTKVAQLQVQLARLQYQLPRLRTSMSITLDQQTGAGGGGFTSRGAGETKLEQSRRRITAQMVHIRQELADLEKGETTRSAQRQNNDLPSVALVGYTNAGKSTLMNRLLARFGVGANNDDSKQVFERDMLFATLNTTVRQLTLPDKKQFLLSDTVGFVSKLPHSLVAAFKSTLQEAASADLLLHVVDVSDPHYQDMMTTTNKTLQEIGVSGRPTITVYNKADRTELVFPEVTGENAITISALDIASQDALIDLIKQHVFKDVAVVNLHIPFDKGNVQAQLAAKHTFLQEDYDDTGTLITVELSTNERETFKDYIV
ncbi:GTPase HflX [Leuconostoc pseudomesenteroides]|jgi:GTP-binding protein HflX|uniref:GTPase HflX n=1 Tax=Leuconostoc falkenbergense TaxID=2766470 RepID=A0A9X3INV9_9LACO|nr:GTPase HflX [Leuconostoc falkenbergense]RDG18165.1 GTPase HflX [Leuconostoc pseudomesenteroides]MCT4389440.1 GTPase HflX [Leuconostoc falkenbergense]MCT4411521.1 GTPase HflX [Leuconostoc falkenbergense]MCX7577837.1 GTPase HflX [Leuconostoc falkenbergense]MDM7646470.1 GTPase HflX [Leuconostoc falkenbergense]